ncbi:hypothetical protein INR49_012688 [Caranx melampygus]|nr:hypothetical protein INR49_012688 [Caranx melampygus]
MTEDPWLGVTSCGSPGSEMCQQQHRRTGASPPVGCFSCVQAADRDFQQGPGPPVAEGETSCSQLVVRRCLWGTGLIAAFQLPPAVGGRGRTSTCFWETMSPIHLT